MQWTESKTTMRVNPGVRNKQIAGVSLFARLFYCRGSDLPYNDLPYNGTKAHWQLGDVIVSDITF